MSRPRLPSLVLLSWCALLAACSPAPVPGASADLIASLPSRPELRIAVIGAGASGLTAAHTLAELGYRHVTVFEKEKDVGGKVQSLTVGQLRAELGAVFASPDYRVVLALAERFGVPHAQYQGPRYVLDEAGRKQTFQQFLTSRYTAAQIQQAVRSYALTLQRFPQIEQDGFANLPPDLALPFSEFAAKHGFVPVAEMARSLVTGFGYEYYETVPAAYVMKLLPWLVKVGPAGLESPPYFVFPGGYQSLWRAVAAPLDVQLGARVTRIERPTHAGQPILVNIEGRGRRPFDAVILSTPLNVVPELMAVTPEERALFGKISTIRYLVTLFFSLNLQQAETVFIHGHARPEKINHLAVWGNPGGNTPVFIGYQLAERGPSAAQLFGTLASDVFQLGGGVFTIPLVQKEWSYFPRVGSEALRDGVFDRIEALQGQGGIYYVGSSLSFETVEHTARYARALVERHFAPAP